jgi:hypothetical protein
MRYKIISFLILIFFFTSAINAQNIESWIEKNEKVPVEKIYLHTDREYYFTGETIWLKGYLTDSRSGRLIPGAENIFIRLIDESGKEAYHLNLLSMSGLAPGHIDLPDTLKPGKYLLQAFTDYLQNFGEESYFHKNLEVSRPSGSPGIIEGRRRSSPLRRMVADVSFLPQGGKMLEGISNLVAFKAIDGSGYGIEAGGVVRDETGAEVVTFTTDYKGMGIFFLTPQLGKSYHAVINGFPSFRFPFDSLIVTDGVKIQVVNQTSRELIVNVAGNSEKFSGEPFYLVNMHRGEVVFYQPFTLEGQNQLLKFDSNMLKAGINQLILLNKNLVPVSERLVFSDNFNLNRLSVNAGNAKHLPRSPVKLSISGDDFPEEVSNLSVAVVHESSFAESGVSHHILSELFLNSELTGFVESPADYFTNTGMDAKARQRLLMLTNGWGSYFWNSVPDAFEPLEYKQTAGLGLRGTATQVATGQPVVNGEITLVIEKDKEVAFLTQNTDGEGNFSFSGLLFKDTARVYVQAKNQRGRQNTNISLVPVIQTKAPVENMEALKSFSSFPKQLEIQKYHQNRITSEFLRKKGLLRSDVRQQDEKQPKGDGHFRIYEQADQIIEVPETESSFGNILDFLTGRVAGLDISGGQVTIRGTGNFDNNSSPLFLMDGVPVITSNIPDFPTEAGRNTSDESRDERNSAVEKIKSIPLGDIDKVEILKSPQNLALFGTEGANGVIAIYTKKGKNIAMDLAKGVIAEKIAGYASYRKFYSPKYLPENTSTEKPDLRTTLFWAPEIVLKNGPAELSFFTSDQTGKYKIIVEGISESGKICVGSADIEVVEETEN